MTSEQYEGLVHNLYQSATGTRPWHEVLQVLVDQFKGRFCQLVAVDRRTGRMALTLHSSGSPMEGVLDYLCEYHRLDPHLAHVAVQPPGTVFNSDDLIPAREAQGHPYYRNFWSVHGVRYMSGGKVAEDEDFVVFFGLLRSPAQGRFDAAADASLASLFVHIKKAFAEYRRSANGRRASTGQLMIEQAERPILLLGPDRFVVHANAAAQQLLSEAEVIVARSGYVGCPSAQAEEALLRALHGLKLAEGEYPQTPERVDRQSFALQDLQGRPIPACTWALRPSETMGAFGDTPRAMLIADVLVPMARGIQPHQHDAIDVPRLALIRRDILARIDRPELSLEQIARQHHLTPRQVQRLFAREDTCFSDFVRQARLQRARDMLSDPAQRHRRVLEIALDSGFDDFSAFSRAFRRHFGMTPSEARGLTG
ncbi:hypothetical protein ASE52_14590 [Acidovorax sp. Root275]|uniref:helix-turn-helix transcriptional regulator n=1 Tax=Acidovorax sp. Root275 TaxID=1736508 RepID=UPI00070AD8D9|nr:helix-turn-helix transcriptional regulator [Acidovorax sp. Root275]KRD48561.1 hypothetical protein ASE52_14590 [Acidovorax sp. Root275]